MRKVFAFFRKELMLTVALIAAAVSLIITPPSAELLKDIDIHTLGTLFMMLCVLEGFKKEDIFRPIIRFAGRMSTMLTLSLFLIFSVFFTSMFVTNDVSLIIFVPLTIILFRAGDKEKYILPVISMENIAAIRGSMLMPFGSPQNLFLFGQSGKSVFEFVLHMAPLCVFSGILLVIFASVLYRRNIKEPIIVDESKTVSNDTAENKKQKICYIILFALIILTIVTRTKFWYISVLIVALSVLVCDRDIYRRVDYILLLTFLCFFVFSSSIARNPAISQFLKNAVGGHEYLWGILLSQGISNVPASIVLYPFTTNLAALLYGADTAGLCSIIGSLASVINYRIYVREYPKNGKKFLVTFTLISWAFFIIVVLPGYYLSKFWQF